MTQLKQSLVNLLEENLGEHALHSHEEAIEALAENLCKYLTRLTLGHTRCPDIQLPFTYRVRVYKKEDYQELVSKQLPDALIPALNAILREHNLP